MDISQSALAWLYLYALLLGIGLGTFYDVFRITRVLLGVHYSRRAARRLQAIELPFLTPKKRNSESRALGVVVFFEDLAFCLFAGIALILLFYQANNGKFRFPVLLCTGAGFLLYRATLGRLVMLFSEVIAFLIETLARYLLFFILLPIRTLFKALCNTAFKLGNAMVQKRRYRMRRGYTANQLDRVARDACGFVPDVVPKNKKMKRGRTVGKRKENTIQPHVFDESASRRPRRGVHRNIRE